MPAAIDAINAILAENVSGAGALDLAPARTFQEIGLTSLGLLRTLLAIERRLGTSVLSPQTIRSLRTVQDLHALFANTPGPTEASR